MSEKLTRKATAVSVATIVAGTMAMPMMAFADDFKTTESTQDQEQLAYTLNAEEDTTPAATTLDNNTTGTQSQAEEDDDRTVEEKAGNENGDDNTDLSTDAMLVNDAGTYTAQFFTNLTIAGQTIEDPNGMYLQFSKETVEDELAGYATFTFYEKDASVDEVDYTFDDTNWTAGETTDNTEELAGYTRHFVSTPYTTELANGETFTLTINEEYLIRECWDVNLIDPATDKIIETYDVSQYGGEIPNLLPEIEDFYLDKELTKPLETMNYLDYAPEDTAESLNIYVKYAEDAVVTDDDTTDAKDDDQALPQTGDLGITGAVVAGVTALAAGAAAVVRRQMMK